MPRGVPTQARSRLRLTPLKWAPIKAPFWIIRHLSVLRKGGGIPCRRVSVRLGGQPLGIVRIRPEEAKFVSIRVAYVGYIVAERRA